jgi:chromosome segregation ATPase
MTPAEQEEDTSLEAADSIQSDLLAVRAQLAYVKEQLAEAHSYIEELEEGKRIVEEARDQVLDSWKFTLSQLGAAKEETRRLTRENKEMLARLQATESSSQSKESELSLPSSPLVSMTGALSLKDTGNSADDDDEVLL